MKSRAAVAWEPKKPLSIEEVDVEGPREGEVLLQVGIYGGIPAAVDSFRLANEAFAEIDSEAHEKLD